MKFYQEALTVRKPRGFHLITGAVLNAAPQINTINIGVMHVFIQHTSASLTINENADPTVRQDMETWFTQQVDANDQDFVHTYEGPDDMPAHIKASVLGSSVTIPIKDGQLLLGTWQGIYLCEHRDDGGERRIILTFWGQ